MISRQQKNKRMAVIRLRHFLFLLLLVEVGKQTRSFRLRRMGSTEREEGSVKGLGHPSDVDLGVIEGVLGISGLDTTLGVVSRATGHHGDAVRDGADRGAEGAASAVLSDKGQVGLSVKDDGLVTRVIAGHVALSAVDAEVLIDEGDDLLTIVETAVVTNAREGKADLSADGVDVINRGAAVGLDNVREFELLSLEEIVLLAVEIAELPALLLELTEAREVMA